jgi:hypothetical protein
VKIVDEASPVGRALGELVRVGSSEAESEFPHESKKRLSAVISEPQAGQ